MKLSDRKLNKNYSICLLGEPGSGRTTLASTAPGKIYYFCFEDGLDSLVKNEAARTKVEYDLYIPKPHLDPSLIPKTALEKTKAIAYPGIGWDKAVIKLRELTLNNPYDCIVIDSLTALSQVALEKIQADNGFLEDAMVSKDTLKLYGSLGQRCLLFFFGVLALDCGKIFIAHENYERNESSGKFQYSIASEGGMFSKRLSNGKDFGELWRTEIVTTKEGEHKYMVRTGGSEKFPAKSRWGCLELLEWPNIEAMLEKVYKTYNVTN